MVVSMSQRRPCVAVAIVPRLFGDAVSRMLRGDDRDVLVFPVEEPLPDPAAWARRIDVAVVSGELPEQLYAEAVVRLPEVPSKGGLGSVRTRDGVEPFMLTDLSDLVDLIERLCEATSEPCA